ncbi:MAG: hypothetical protein ACTSPB_06525 [Candidatus Thorarchaeota archaeon]
MRGVTLIRLDPTTSRTPITILIRQSITIGITTTSRHLVSIVSIAPMSTIVITITTGIEIPAGTTILLSMMIKSSVSIIISMIIIVAVVIVAIIVIDGVYDDSSRSRGRDNYSNAEIPAGYSHNRSCDNCRGQGGRAPPLAAQSARPRKPT